MDQNEQVRQLMQHMGPAIFLFWGMVYLVKVALYIIPLYQTCKKSGVSPAIAFLAAIPLIGRLLAMYIISFSEWRVTPVQPVMYPPQSFPPPTYPPATPPTQF